MEYASVDEAKAVFDKPENIILDGRVIYIDYASRAIDEKPSESLKRLSCFTLNLHTSGDLVTRGVSSPTSTLFVKNLWYGSTEEALKRAFNGCSTVRIPIDPITGKNKG